VARQPERLWSRAARLSIAARLAVLFASVALVSFSLLSVTLHWVLVKELDRHQMEQIHSRMEDMRYMLIHSQATDLSQRARAKIEALTPADGRNRYWIYSADPAFCLGPELESVVAASQGKEGMFTWDVPGRSMRLLAIDLPANTVRPQVRLIVGTDHGPFAQTQRSFELALVVLTLLGTLVTAFAGYWVAHLGLLPLQRMSDEAHRIKPGKPSQRLALPVLPAELADLGGSLNAALDRLDVAYSQLEAFNDNVAHELRTPLANLIGQTQVALSRPRGGQELREVLQSNLEELERVRSIVADMLFLARAEQGARASDRVPASIAAEVAKTLEFMELLFDEAGVRVSTQGDTWAPIQTALFRRALINLLHNALQHSSAGSEIRVEISEVDNHACVAVVNQGPDMAPQHLPRLFDRFYRVEESRANSGESHGLGLAIVKAVALMHQGRVFVSSAGGETRVGFDVAQREA
jgi:two-component system heavy metal sensor histidine kinase CusS